MPLLKGKSKKVISSNIGELVSSFKRTGKIGSATPETMAKARKQAIAAAFASAGKGKG